MWHKVCESIVKLEAEISRVFFDDLVVHKIWMLSNIALICVFFVQKKFLVRYVSMKEIGDAVNISRT